MSHPEAALPYPVSGRSLVLRQLRGCSTSPTASGFLPVRGGTSEIEKALKQRDCDEKHNSGRMVQSDIVAEMGRLDSTYKSTKIAGCCISLPSVLLSCWKVLLSVCMIVAPAARASSGNIPKLIAGIAIGVSRTRKFELSDVAVERRVSTSVG